MKHYALHLTWACQNHCSYCWVEQSVRTRPEQRSRPLRPMEDWANAIRRDMSSGVDVAELLGGEPLLVPWLGDLIAACPDTRFALSTNGLLDEKARALAERRLPNLISVNLSMHPESEEHTPDYLTHWQASLEAFRAAGVPLCVNLVDTPTNRERCQFVGDWLKERGVPFLVNPNEDVAHLDEKTETGLECQGGTDHLLIAPDGEAWPCFTALRSPYWREYSLGNWLDGTVDVSRKPVPCYLKCVDYYVLPQQHTSGDMWGVRARPCVS